MYNQTAHEKMSGTSGEGNVKVPPAALIRAFGEGYESDGYKVSCEWVFEDGDGGIFTLYDWKATSLYSKQNPVPKAFWAFEAVEEIHIGCNDRGRASVSDFKAFVLQACKARPYLEPI